MHTQLLMTHETQGGEGAACRVQWPSGLTQGGEGAACRVQWLSGLTQGEGAGWPDSGSTHCSAAYTPKCHMSIQGNNTCAAAELLS